MGRLSSRVARDLVKNSMTGLTSKTPRSAAAAALFFGAVLIVSRPAAAQPEAAALPPLKAVETTPRAASGPPKILSAEDAARYTEIFALQEDGEWKAADNLIKRLDDTLLMGHVLAQRYLHPHKWRSTYKQLKAYMADYADHPDATRLYKLALRRRPGNWKHPEPPAKLPARPVYETHGAGASSVGVRGKITLPRKRLTRKQRREAHNIRHRVRKALRRGHTLVAKRVILQKRTAQLLSPQERDQLKAWLGLRYFHHGRTDWTLKWAGDAVRRSGRLLPEANWAMGLAHWKKKNHEAAAKHFKAASDAGFSDPWIDGAASFWAARALMVTRQPAEVNEYLRRAARHARTFYGLLAARVLGREVKYRWRLDAANQEAVTALSERPRGRRALALMEAGQIKRAGRELRNLSRVVSRSQVESLLAMADAAGMASLAVRLSDRLFPDGGGYDGGAYPIPHWAPAAGFQVDRALVYALIRQESKFNPKAKSWAGARGLMQIMPLTASFVAKDRRLRQARGRNRLYDPQTNLKLGQQYIKILLNEPHIQGDLMRMVMAWNGGPGNLRKWKREIEYDADPLFFIESLPARETRDFVERVLSNLWIYRDRLGQAKPSLDALAAGEWPRYIPLGQGQVEVAFRGD